MQGQGVRFDSFSPSSNIQNQFDMRQVFRVIFSDKHARKATLFSIFMIGIVAAQVFFGSLVGSVGLISAAYCSSYDAVGLLISVIALVISKQEPTKLYSYGFDRIEVLASFGASSVMIFLGLSSFFQSCEEFVEGEVDLKIMPMVNFSILGLVISILCMYFFKEHLSFRSESIISDTLYEDSYAKHIRSLAPFISVLIASLIMLVTGWAFIDPLIGCINSIYLMRRAFPSTLKSGRILLQSVPLSIESVIHQSLKEASKLVGVIDINQAHFWTSAPSVFVGTMVVKINVDADRQIILQQVNDIFSPYIQHLTIQVEK